MDIDLVRRWFGPTTTISQVYIGQGPTGRSFGGLWFAYGLENKDEGDEKNQVRGSDRAVPCGTYELYPRFSPSHKRDMWFLRAVPGRENIMIHSGNDESHTLGCLMFGLVHKGWTIGQSKDAMDYVDSVLKKDVLNRIRIRRDLLQWQEYTGKK